MRRFPIFTLAWLLAAGSAQGPVWSEPPRGPDPPTVLQLAEATRPPGAGKAVASQQAPGENAPPVGQESLVAAAVRTLETRDSVSAKIRHEVDLFDKHLVGSGVYLEQRPGRDHLLRLEMRIQLGDRSSSLVQVCDGHYLWTYQNMPPEAKLSRIDVTRVLRTLQRADKTIKQGEMGAIPGIGGLPKLLRGLDAAFDFSSVEQGRWGQRKLPVWRLQGQWKRPELVKLLPRQKEAIEKGTPPDLSKLAEHLPDHVVVLLGQEDLFPYRIEYRRTLPEKPGQTSQRSSRAVVTMDLFEVTINSPIDATQFIYNPGESEVTDQTDAFLASLGVNP